MFLNLYVKQQCLVGKEICVLARGVAKAVKYEVTGFCVFSHVFVRFVSGSHKRTCAQACVWHACRGSVGDAGGAKIKCGDKAISVLALEQAVCIIWLKSCFSSKKPPTNRVYFVFSTAQKNAILRYAQKGSKSLSACYGLHAHFQRKITTCSLWHVCVENWFNCSTDKQVLHVSEFPLEVSAKFPSEYLLKEVYSLFQNIWCYAFCLMALVLESDQLLR